MSDQWLRQWFPVVGMMLQVIFWGQFINLHGSRRLQAIMTNQPLPEDPDF